MLDKNILIREHLSVDVHVGYNCLLEYEQYQLCFNLN